ncbi:OmpA family protein [Hymenobacter persicinus]|uniref:DUF937 domain-containing protein n=1 Tax=Hymenobacter persicinus TaxID=2025506 RepID=A0A4Q5LAS3_9BACT|nr:OmpA family protein [Hymenobacter persicinus]RYU79149.1 DUF937 domain-containing protein [Hymenobacter persicinus]
MSQNLLALVQDYFTGDTVRQTSTALGESESGVGTALKSVVPLALAALFARSQQSGGLSDVFSMSQQAHSTGLLNNLGGLLGGLGSGTMTANTTSTTDGGLLNRGAELLRSVLGGGYSTAVEGVSQQSGVRTSSVGSLLSMAVPVVLGLLGRHAAQNNLDERGLGTYLGEQRSSITGALSSLPGNLGGILSTLGLGGAAAAMGSAAHNVGNAMDNTAHRVAGGVRGAVTEVERNTPSRWPWLLAALLALAAIWWLMRSCDRKPEPAATTTETVTTDTTAMAPAAPAPAAAPTGRYDASTGNYIYDIGTDTQVKLPDGTVLNIGSNSVESRLFNFLNDANQTVSDDKTQGWMSLDRVYFNTGKSTLTAESQAQLKNIAAILKAFPNAALKLGGYTDNVGKADMNLTLSADRANAARKALLNNGVDAGRVAAEGYGQEHPIASNDTPEGKAQNRRVDVRVTKK